jgi:hypothetical protein
MHNLIIFGELMVALSEHNPLKLILKIGESIDDAQDIRLQKSLLVAGNFMFIWR